VGGFGVLAFGGGIGMFAGDGGADGSLGFGIFAGALGCGDGEDLLLVLGCSSAGASSGGGKHGDMCGAGLPDCSLQVRGLLRMVASTSIGVGCC